MSTPAPSTPSGPPAVPAANTPAATFDVMWDAFNVWLTTVLWPYLVSVVSSTATNAAEAETAASAATVQAAAAASSAAAAAGAANFKGNWSDLTGPLNMPACVKHAGRFWLLTANLPDVTAATPGVSGSWIPLDVGTVPTQVVTSSGSVSAVVGVRYIIASNSVTLTAPSAGLLKGDYHGVRVMSGVTGFTWDFGSTNVRSLTPGVVTWKSGTTPVDLFFEDATRGFV